MKILLLNPPKEKEITFAVLTDYNTKARNNNPPLGLLYLHSYLSPYHNVDVVDMSAEELGILNIHNILLKYKPDIVGITCVISKWPTTKELSRQIKIFNKDIITIVGGVNPSLYTYETLQCEDIDYVIRGFGQIPLLELCNALDKKETTTTIKNCCTKETYRYPEKGCFNFEDIDKYPFPNRKIVPIDNYNMPFSPKNPTTSMLTSFGCFHKCHFCQCRTFTPIVIRKPEYVIDELKEVKTDGIKSVIFQDELFTMSNRRITDICTPMIENKIDLNWAIRARATHLKQESLDLMRQAGCFNIHMGIESGTDRILKRMNKNITVPQIKESIKAIKKAGMSCSASFMLGYPGETKEEILETIYFAAELELNVCQFYITIPSPGTELYKEWQERTGYKGDVFSQFTMNPDSIDLDGNIASDLFTREEMNEFVQLGFSKTNNLYKIKND
jgi:radical SAM superfamily enzyme YgiQ (UPF0313 family)